MILLYNSKMWLCKPRIPKPPKFHGDLESLMKIRNPFPCSYKTDIYTLEFIEDGTVIFSRKNGVEIVRMKHSPKQEDAEMMVLRGSTISVSTGFKLTYMIKISSMTPLSPQTPNQSDIVTHIASLYMGVKKHMRRVHPLLIRSLENMNESS
jgi:hypothetical protein